MNATQRWSREGEIQNADRGESAAQPRFELLLRGCEECDAAQLASVRQNGHLLHAVEIGCQQADDRVPGLVIRGEAVRGNEALCARLGGGGA
eukprot:991623-Pleurochrysis_carterae.AAC.1